MRPHRRQPTRLPRPWDSPGNNTGVGCHFLLQCMKVKSESEVAQSCPTCSDPMDCSLPGSIHGILGARVLEWLAIAFCYLFYLISIPLISPSHHHTLLPCFLFFYSFYTSQFSSFLSCVQLFATPWTAAFQASLSITSSRSLLKPMSIESVMPSNHLILSLPSPPALNLSRHQDFFKWVSSSHRWPKCWRFSFNISPSSEHPGLIFRMLWLDLLAVQGTLKSLLQHHSSKDQFFGAQLFYSPTLTSIPDH